MNIIKLFKNLNKKNLKYLFINLQIFIIYFFVFYEFFFNTIYILLIKKKPFISLKYIFPFLKNCINLNKKNFLLLPPENIHNSLNILAEFIIWKPFFFKFYI